MKIETSPKSADTLEADWLVLFATSDKGAPSLPNSLATAIAKLRDTNDFEGKANELFVWYGFADIKAPRLLLVGLGESTKVTPMSISRAAGTAIRSIATKKRSTVAFAYPPCDLPAHEVAAAVVAGVSIGLAGQDLYKKERNRHPIDVLLLQSPSNEVDAVTAGILRGETIATAVNLARHLVNQSPAELYPETFCSQAQAALGDTGVTCEVFTPEDLAKHKMECILAVGGGSVHPPRLLVMRYQGPNSKNEAKPLCLVGKGITFDSGGLSIKTADGMTDMKCDMAGAATVVAALQAIARLKLPIAVVGIAALAENMTGGSAFRPGDVLTAKNGKTIEILNTDAEGRLVLADALSHAVDLGVGQIVDMATLTGACMVALGTKVAGVMTNDEAWSQQIIAAAGRAGERVWPLPMFEEYDELIKSQVADMKNIGGRWGGAISAAKLLAEFVGTTPWTHIDLAGPAYADKDASYQDGGGTGFFVRTLVELAETMAKS
jgi:leucyl aminopeptidase